MYRFTSFLILIMLCLLNASSWAQSNDYAWVWTEVRVDNASKTVSKSNKNYAGVYWKETDVDANGITHLVKYVGPTKASPPAVRGEHLGVRTEWSKLPTVVKPGAPLDMTLAMEVTRKYVKHFHWGFTSGASLGRVGKDGKFSGWTNFTQIGKSNATMFFVNAKQGYKPVSVKVRRNFPKKAKVNDQVVVRISAWGQNIAPKVYHIYTWKEVSVSGRDQSDALLPLFGQPYKVAPANSPASYGNIPWIFLEDGSIYAPDAWKGRWSLKRDHLEVTITHQGVQDRFQVFIKPGTRRSFRAMKNGNPYRYGVLK